LPSNSFEYNVRLKKEKKEKNKTEKAIEVLRGEKIHNYAVTINDPVVFLITH
jgi:hypothetical protein